MEAPASPPLSGPDRPLGTEVLGVRAGAAVDHEGWRWCLVAVPSDLDGPPGVLQGGIVTGLSVELARDLHAPGAPLHGATVRLEGPTPLGATVTARARRGERPGTVEVETWHHERRLTHAEVDLTGPASLDLAVDLGALAGQPLPVPSTEQPHPTCFACGGGSPSPLALRLRPGPVRERDIIAPWVPDARFGAEMGPMVLAAALDCPPAWALLDLQREAGHRHLLLGTMHLRSAAPVLAGDPVLVTAIADGRDGRKLYARSAIVDTDGRVLAMVSVIDIAVG
jgi:hypothetical protein